MFGKKSKAQSMGKDGSNKQAEMVKLIKSTFEKAGWKYDFKSEDNIFLTSFMGDDLPIATMIAVQDLSTQFICNLDFIADPGNFKEVCWALNEINSTLSFGCFYLDTEEGHILFEYGLIHVDSDFEEGTLASVLKMVVSTVDKYDGDLQKIAKKSSGGYKDYSNNMFA